MTPTSNRALFPLLLLSAIWLLPTANAQEIEPLDSRAYAAQPRTIVEPDFGDIPSDYPLPESITARLKVLADGSIAEVTFPDPSDEKLAKALRAGARLWMMYPQSAGVVYLLSRSFQTVVVFPKRDEAGKIKIELSTGGVELHSTKRSALPLSQPKIKLVAVDDVLYPRAAARQGINAGWVRVVGRVGPGDALSDLYIFASSPPKVFDRAVADVLKSMRIKVNWGTQEPRPDWPGCFTVDYRFIMEGTRRGKEIPLSMKPHDGLLSPKPLVPISPPPDAP